MYIVAEYLFLENFIINYAILHTTKIVTRTKVGKIRIFLMGIITALYPFVFFFESTIFLTNFYMKIIISIILIKFAYNAKSLRLYLKQLSAFYCISFIFAGASMGSYYFINNYFNMIFEIDSFQGGFPVKYLILGILFGAIMIINVLYYYHEKKIKENFILEVEISLNNKKVNIIALTDTGNSLVEPISKSPVFVVEYNSLKNLLPIEINRIFEEDRENDFISLEKAIKKLEDEITIRIIPFNAIGISNGMLIGFKPDSIIINEKNCQRTYENLIIGIFKGTLSTDNQYTGLLNLEILNRGNLCVNEN